MVEQLAMYLGRTAGPLGPRPLAPRWLASFLASSALFGQALFGQALLGSVLLGQALLGCASRGPGPAGPEGPVGETRLESSSEDEPPAQVETGDPALTSAPLDRAALNALAEERRIAAQTELARAALAQIPSPENDLGVVVSLSERASDLEWLLAIQNRGQHPVLVKALPELLSYEVTPAAKPESETDPPAVPVAKAAKATPAKPKVPTVCGSVPKEPSHHADVTLLPGEILAYAFDPRDYCNDADVLREGATILPRFGLPVLTKKVWRKGKLVEETPEQKPPFAFSLAEDADLPGTTETGTTELEPAATRDPSTPPLATELKYVGAPSFVLGTTYPLARVAPLGLIMSPEEVAAAEALEKASAEKAAPSGPDEPEADVAPSRAAPTPPPPPLTLTVRRLPTTARPDASTVTVSAKNTSGHAMRLFLRRELISYQVSGPKGPTTCRMTPTERAPVASAYSSLPAGGVIALTTRLAEACPAGTFDTPGSYTVFARVDAQNSGREHGLVAFTGTAITREPATLTVRGPGMPERPAMRLLSGR